MPTVSVFDVMPDLLMRDGDVDGNGFMGRPPLKDRICAVRVRLSRDLVRALLIDGDITCDLAREEPRCLTHPTIDSGCDAA